MASKGSGGDASDSDASGQGHHPSPHRNGKKRPTRAADPDIQTSADDRKRPRVHKDSQDAPIPQKDLEKEEGDDFSDQEHELRLLIQKKKRRHELAARGSLGARCPKCQSRATIHQMVQLRSADEGMSSVHLCMVCKNKWTRR